jgi:hypothetical protein
MRLHQAYAVLHGKKSRVKFTSSHDIYDWWRHTAVSDYRRRKLTKESDRLPALSGLATAFQALTGDTYLAGLWAGICFTDYYGNPVKTVDFLPNIGRRLGRGLQSMVKRVLL